jgi:hypothetical protein
MSWDNVASTWRDVVQEMKTLLTSRRKELSSEDVVGMLIQKVAYRLLEKADGRTESERQNINNV